MELKTCESPGKLAHFFLMRSSMFSLAVYLQGDCVFKSFKVFLCTVSSQLCVNRGEKSLGKKTIFDRVYLVALYLFPPAAMICLMMLLLRLILK